MTSNVINLVYYDREGLINVDTLHELESREFTRRYVDNVDWQRSNLVFITVIKQDGGKIYNILRDRMELSSDTNWTKTSIDQKLDEFIRFYKNLSFTIMNVSREHSFWLDFYENNWNYLRTEVRTPDSKKVIPHGHFRISTTYNPDYDLD